MCLFRERGRRALGHHAGLTRSYVLIYFTDDSAYETADGQVCVPVCSLNGAECGCTYYARALSHNLSVGESGCRWGMTGDESEIKSEKR